MFTLRDTPVFIGQDDPNLVNVTKAKNHSMVWLGNVRVKMKLRTQRVQSGHGTG